MSDCSKNFYDDENGAVNVDLVVLTVGTAVSDGAQMKANETIQDLSTN